MACCPRDEEPLILTLEQDGAEFVCQVCGTFYGYMAPVPRPVTPEREARLEELRRLREESRR